MGIEMKSKPLWRPLLSLVPSAIRIEISSARNQANASAIEVASASVLTQAKYDGEICLRRELLEKLEAGNKE
jgi:hypothetical protein